MDTTELVKKEALRRGYSIKTIKTYCYCIERFFKRFDKDIKKITKKDIHDYLDKFVEKNISGNTINVHLNALKFLMQEILGKKLLIKIRYSKVPRKLPVILTKEEIIKILSVIKNKKHGLMIKLMYSAGLRVSELVNLRVNDLELNMNYGYVRKGKGNKDRLFIIAESLKNELINYIKENNLTENLFLFKGYNDYHLSPRTVQEIVKKATKKAKIGKKVTSHTFRHSFSTHLIENGYSITSVQFLLGHKSSETTRIYIHTAMPTLINVKSPLDDFYNPGVETENLIMDKGNLSYYGFKG